jgi:PAS domain S-box-containing protein
MRVRKRNKRRRRPGPTKIHGSPLRFFIILVISIFIVEGMVMYLLHSRLLHLPIEMDILIDPLLLIIGIFPVLYFFSFRPLLQSIKKFRRIDRRLKNRKALLEDVLNGVHEGIGVVDANENIVFCNQAYAKIFDETPGSIVGRNMSEFVDDETHCFILQQTGERKKGKISTYEIPIHTSKGASKHIRVSVSPRFDKDGSYEGAFGAILDITDQKLSDEKLRQTLSRIEHVCSVSPTVIYSCSVDSKDGKNTSFTPTFVSDNIKQLFGHEVDEYLGNSKWWSQHIHPEDSQQAVRNMTQLFAEGRLVHEYRIRHKDGTYRWVRDAMQLVNDLGGNPIEFVGSWMDITDQMKFEETTKEQASFVRQNPAPVLSTDYSGNLIFLNPAAREIFGEDVGGKSVFSILTGCKKSYVSGVAELKQVQFEQSIGDRAFLFTLKKDLGTRSLYLYGSDITDLIRTEEKLREKEIQFKSIVENASEAVISADISGKIVFWNPAAEKIFGYTAEEALGREIVMIIPESLRQSHLDGIRRLNETGRPKIMGKTVEVPGLKKGGSEIPLELSLVNWKKGEELFFSSIIRDVSDRKEAEEKLKASEERHRMLFEKSNEGILVADCDTLELQYANPAICRMLGYTEDELSQMVVTDIHPQEGLEEAMSEFEACSRGEKDLVTNIPCIRKNGEIFYNNVSTALILYDEKPSIVGFFTDISELKKLNAMKEEFISTVSHELRTPLTSIYGSLNLINKGMAGDMPDQVKHLVDIAGRNTVRLKCLVDDILDIEKLESGKMEFIMAPLRLAPLVKESIEENESFGKEFSVDFVMDDVLPDIEVNVDSNRLAQVMNNLLSNAAKFSPPGSQVEVSVVRHDGIARVSVKDHGKGIPEEFQGRIFQKFSQAESILDRETKGSGLGLNISKAIIERLGGTIEFETEIGIGTTFYFELPEWEGGNDNDHS